MKSLQLAWLFCLTVVVACSQLGTEKDFNEYYMEEEYNGVVVHTLVDVQGASYRLENGKTFGWRGEMYPNYSKYIEEGDTCVKSKGSLILTVLRSNGDTVLMDLSWDAVVRGSFEMHSEDGKVSRFTIDQMPIQK